MIKILILILSISSFQAAFIANSVGQIYNNSNLIYTLNSSLTIHQIITAIGYCGQNLIIGDTSGSIHILTNNSILSNLGRPADEYIPQIITVQNHTYFLTTQALYQMSPTCTTWTLVLSLTADQTMATPMAGDHKNGVLYIFTANPIGILSYTITSQAVVNLGYPTGLGTSTGTSLYVGPDGVLYAAYASNIRDDIFVYSYNNGGWSQVCSQPGLEVNVNVITFDRNENLVIGASSVNEENALSLWFLTYVQGECLWAQYVNYVPFQGLWIYLVMDIEDNINAVIGNQAGYTYQQYNQVDLSWNSFSSYFQIPYFFLINYESDTDTLLITLGSNLYTLSSGKMEQTLMNYAAPNNSITAISNDSDYVYAALRNGFVIGVSFVSRTAQVIGLEFFDNYFTRLCSSPGSFYAIGTNASIFYYDSLLNTWNSIDPPANQEGVGSYTCQNGCIYALFDDNGTQYIWKFCNNNWEYMTNFDSNTVNGYVITTNGSVLISAPDPTDDSDGIIEFCQSTCSQSYSLIGNFLLMLADNSGNAYLTLHSNLTDTVYFYNTTSVDGFKLISSDQPFNSVNWMFLTNNIPVVVDSQNNFYELSSDTWEKVANIVPGNIVAVSDDLFINPAIFDL